jgi:nitrite reductase/ring-hydroxylating ferredoxin subunit/uncharacterized protein with PQ loop repeat
VLTATQIAGFIGAALAGVAYVPQIWHLVRERCAAGISRPAFAVWLAASLLVTVHAVATRAAVFVTLGVLQVLAISVVLVCATRYRDSSCAGHVHLTSRRTIRLERGVKGMSQFSNVARTEEIPEGEMAAFDVDGQRVAVANVAGSLHAFGDICTHAHCSLADGELEGTTVTCPCHGSQFDVTTGEVLNPPATEAVPAFRLRVEDGEIQVEA